METINDRIQIILEKSGMTKTAFGDTLKVSQQYISKLTKSGNPSERLIDDICEKIIIHGRRINKVWLQTGNGKMFAEIPQNEEFNLAADMIRQDHDTNAMNAVIEYWKLDPSSKQAIWNFIHDLSKHMSDNEIPAASTPKAQADITLDPRDTDALSAAVREAEESYIKSRSGSARRKDLSATSITDGESGEVVNR